MLLVAGCVPRSPYVTAEMVSERTISRTMAPPVVTRVGSLDVHVVVLETTTTISTVWPRECFWEIRERSLLSYPRRTPDVVTRSMGGFRRPCAAPAVGVPLHVELASGAIVEGTTDETGRWSLLLGTGEDGSVRSVTPGPVTAPRPDVERKPRTRPAEPKLRASPNRDLAMTLTRTALARAKAKDCATVRVLAQRVRSLDPSYYAAVFERDTAIAACLP